MQFLVLLGLQVLLLKEFILFGYAYCFAYIGAFLLLPFELGTIACMLIAFATGLVVDIFYDTLGIHAMASVLVAFLRSYVLKALTPAGGYENYMEPTLPSMGLNWYLLFFGTLSMVHHTALLGIEYAQFNMLGIVLLKAALSTVLTLVITVIVQNVLVPR